MQSGEGRRGLGVKTVCAHILEKFCCEDEKSRARREGAVGPKEVLIVLTGFLRNEHKHVSKGARLENENKGWGKEAKVEGLGKNERDGSRGSEETLSREQEKPSSPWENKEPGEGVGEEGCGISAGPAQGAQVQCLAGERIPHATAKQPAYTVETLHNQNRKIKEGLWIGL